MTADGDVVPAGYAELLEQLKARVRSTQVRAARAANSEVLALYWSVGRDILDRQDRLGWGGKVVDRLAGDLRAAFPDQRGWSRRNLQYMRAFAAAWPDREDFVHQAGAQLPWRHMTTLLDRLDTREDRDWYAAQAAGEGWSRAVLEYQIGTGLRRRVESWPTGYPATGSSSGPASGPGSPRQSSPSSCSPGPTRWCCWPGSRRSTVRSVPSRCPRRRRCCPRPFNPGSANRPTHSPGSGPTARWCSVRAAAGCWSWRWARAGASPSTLWLPDRRRPLRRGPGSSGDPRRGRGPAVGSPSVAPRVWSELAAGWREFSSRTWLWAVVVAFMAVNAAVTGGLGVLGPVMADATFGRAAWGFVLAAQTIGLVLGGLLALRLRVRRLLRFGTVMVAAEALPLLALGLNPVVPVLIGAAFVAGIALEQFGIAWDTTLQQHIPADRLARVYSYDMLGSFLAIPAGEVAAGPLAGAFGARATLVAAAAVVVVATAAALTSTSLRELTNTALTPVDGGAGAQST